MTVGVAQAAEPLCFPFVRCSPRRAPWQARGRRPSKRGGVLENTISSFQSDYSCHADAEKTFERFKKSTPRAFTSCLPRTSMRLSRRGPEDAPRASDSDIHRYDKWTVAVSCERDPARAKALRRRKGYTMLLSSVPTPEENPENGITDEKLVRLYASEWRIEWNFRGKKRPVMVERLFMKDVERAAALITIVNIGALVRAMVQLPMRRGLSRLSDDELPTLGREGRSSSATSWPTTLWRPARNA